MNSSVFIFIENLKYQPRADFLKQRFSGICAGHELKNINLSFEKESIDLAIGYYIFKIRVQKICSYTLYGSVESFKFFRD